MLKLLHTAILTLGHVALGMMVTPTTLLAPAGQGGRWAVKSFQRVCCASSRWLQQRGPNWTPRLSVGQLRIQKILVWPCSALTQKNPEGGSSMLNSQAICTISGYRLPPKPNTFQEHELGVRIAPLNGEVYQ